MKRSNPFTHFVDDPEKEAEDFLRHYGLSQCIAQPQQVPIEFVAETRMGLNVIDSEYLSSDDSVQGAITFSKGTIAVYDWENKGYVGLHVDFPTIFIDAGIVNEGRLRNTLAHECYHWFAHRQYFVYSRAHYQDTAFAFRCNIREKASDSWNDLDRMEWQARIVAPKILMPLPAFKIKAVELFQSNGAKTPRQIRFALPTVIDQIARFFGVSQQSAAIRLEEVGYKHATDAYYSPDEFKVSNVAEGAHQSLARRRLQPLDLQEAFDLYCQNDYFRSALDTNAFRFIDGYFVLKKSELSIFQDGAWILLPDALQHAASGILDVVSYLEPITYQSKKDALLFRSDSVYASKKAFTANTQNDELFNIARKFEKEFSRSCSKHQTVNEYLLQCMQDAKWNATIFTAKTGLDEMNYSRVKKPDHKFKLETLVAMGFGLEFTVSEMKEVAELAGFSFSPTNRAHQAYLFLIAHCQGKTIDECNDFLSEINIPTLGSHSRN